ncbi:MAG: hypothetical protein JJU05_05020 [Verrucomicrobia bacterium]|nr:hypothetical protein [Verrucomicrobiota bacterium]MCH8526790.1 hypothetical protein [Kiritimatiellia bacterium]
MKLILRQIPGLVDEPSSVWKVRALAIDDKCPVIEELLKWKQSEPAEFNKILKAMKVAAATRQVRDPKKVKACANPAYKGTYEFRAHKGQARVMFFYHEEEESLIVCTVPFFGKGGSAQKQDTAFKQCHELKTHFEKAQQ